MTSTLGKDWKRLAGLDGLHLLNDNGTANSRVSHDSFHFHMLTCLTQVHMYMHAYKTRIICLTIMQCYVLSCVDQNHFNMQANAILTCMKCYIYGIRFKHICVSIITHICELAKGGGVNRHEII